jgi:hypothetical protein
MSKCMRPRTNLSYLTGIGCSDELALQWGKALDLSAYSGTDDFFALLGLVQLVSLVANTFCTS